jgi:hypothetical protein
MVSCYIVWLAYYNVAFYSVCGYLICLHLLAPIIICIKQQYTYTGYSADIYSFAVLLWQMLMMEKPYDSVSSTHGYLEMVAKVGARPKIDKESWGPSLTGFIKSCWHQDLTKRPSASHASAVLKREAAKAIGGSDLELNNFRRKSTFVNRDSLIEKRKSSIAAHR